MHIKDGNEIYFVKNLFGYLRDKCYLENEAVALVGYLPAYHPRVHWYSSAAPTPPGFESLPIPEEG